MPRPAILIGLGTTGSSIIGRIYARYAALLDQRLVREDQVQFISIDSDASSRAGDPWVSQLPGPFLDMTDPNADDLRRELWEGDDFFRVWWDQNFTRIGPAVNGAGTIPAKGRLVFWGNKIHPGDDNFPETIERAIARATNVMRLMETASVAFYLVATGSGGSGSGIFVDIAAGIRELCERRGLPDPEINGCLLLPSVVRLRALPSIHDQIEANGFGTLQAIDFWQGGKRPTRFRPLMRSPYMTIEGASAPFDLVYLVGSTNSQGKALGSWDDVGGMVADGIGSEVLGGIALQTNSRKNDFVMRLAGLGDFQGKPTMYASFASSRLTFRRDALLGYLARRAAHLLAEETRQHGASMDIAAEARMFLERHRIRERSEKADEVRNEVLEALMAAREEMRLYDAVPFAQRLRSPSIARRTLETALRGLRDDQRARLSGKVPGERGVALKVLVQANRADLARRVLSATRPAGEAIGGLAGWVAAILERPNGGTGRALDFLGELEAEVKVNKDDLEKELAGNEMMGIDGDRLVAERLADDEEVAFQAQKGGEIIFPDWLRLHAGDREGGIRSLLGGWWEPWHQAEQSVLLKDEAIAFYDQVLAAVETQRQVVNLLRAQVERVGQTLLEGAAAELGRHTDPHRYVLESGALEDRVVVDKAFLTPPPAYTDDLRVRFGSVLAECAARLADGLNRPEAGRAELLGSISEGVHASLMASLLEVGRGLVVDTVSKLSLWEALRIQAEHEGRRTPRELSEYFNGQVQVVARRAVPFWSVDTPRMRPQGLVEQVMVSVSFNRQALDAFIAQHGLDRSYDPLAAAAEADAIRASSDSRADPDTIEIRVAQGGLPLFLLREPELLTHSFNKFRSARANTPCQADARYATLPRTFEPITSEAAIVPFLIAEQLGLVTSPFVRSNGRDTSGRYMYRATSLGDSRPDVLEQLQMGGAHAEIFKALQQDVADYLEKTMTPDQRADVYCQAFGRLEKAVSKRGGGTKVQAELLVEYRALEQHLAHEMGLSRFEIDRRLGLVAVAPASPPAGGAAPPPAPAPAAPAPDEPAPDEPAPRRRAGRAAGRSGSTGTRRRRTGA